MDITAGNRRYIKSRFGAQRRAVVCDSPPGCRFRALSVTDLRSICADGVAESEIPRIAE